MAKKEGRSKSSKDAYGAESESKVLHIAPENLVLVEDKKHPLYDPRVHLPVDEALVLSIMSSGVLENVTIRKNPENHDIEVVDGRQRVKATFEANKRLRKSKQEIVLVPCTPRKGDDATLFGVSIATFIRTDDSPRGRSEKLRRFLEMGRSEEQAAVTFGCSAATIKNMLALLEATAAVRDAVEKERISASVGYTLAKLSPEEQKKRLAEILAKAPRVAGKKHSKGGGKARDIAAGKKSKRKKKLSAAEDDAQVMGVRSKAQIRKIAERLEESHASGEDKRIIDCVFKWLAGDDSAFDEWLVTDETKPEPPESGEQD